MDQIQKTLIKAGRKDLAQKYFEKVQSVQKKSNIQSKIDAIKQALTEDATISGTRREIVADILAEYSKFNYQELQGLKVKMTELLTNPEFATKMQATLAKVEGLGPDVFKETEALRQDFFNYINSDKSIARVNFIAKLKSFIANLTDAELKTLYEVENSLADLVRKYI
jgi:uncharacterized protein YnzC (UPF0291/DUF896 family)